RIFSRIGRAIAQLPIARFIVDPIARAGYPLVNSTQPFFDINAMENEIAEVIREHGWFSADVNDGDPPFMYTIGLMQTWDHPELIMFGRQSQTAYRLLSRMVQS